MNKAQLIVKAQSLGLATEGLTVDQLKVAIKNAEAEKFAELTVAVSEANEEFENLPEDATEEVVAAAQQKIVLAQEALAEYTGVPNAKAPEETLGVIELDGRSYSFKKTTPERFNFLGKNRSQAEWLEDKDAMELLIGGNSSYIKLLKK